MRKVSAKLCICLLLCALIALLFSCAGTEQFSIDVGGDLYPGSSLTLVVRDGNGEVAAVPGTFAVTSGGTVASIQGDVLIIAKSARIGDKFTVALSGEGIALSASFEVQAPPVSRVSVVCKSEAAAGEVITLGANISPAVYSGETATFTVKEGKATVSGNVLTIAEDADRNDVVIVTASYGGVTGAEKRIIITTYQPKSITITSETDACMPGDSMSVTAEVEPSYADYPLETEIEVGGDYARYDAELGRIFVDEDARMGSAIVFKATCNILVERATFLVGHPTATDITADSGGRSVSPGDTKSMDFVLYPVTADREKVHARLVKGSEYVEWDGGMEFKVLTSAPRGAEIAFILYYSDDVQTAISFTVEPRKAESVTLTTQATASSYLACGATASFTANVSPADWAGDVYYDVLEGEDLVEQTSDGVFTVKEGAGRGIVRVQARTSDGVRSEVSTFSVRGRYLRVVCTKWDDISFTLLPTSVWFVLPTAAHTADRTIIVPRETTDIILEGHYDGTEETAYKGLYFYFRNAAVPRTVTLSHFATIADYGLGGTVMEFGSSGITTIVLEGKNAVTADTPRYIDNTGEIVNGEWSNKSNPSNREMVWRNGKDGYNGANGGTAMSGCELVFKGEEGSSLVLTAGNGTNGSPGGNGANARYISGVAVYEAGNGGAGGNGGDSGVAIRAESVTFESGFVQAIAGYAGKGASGGAGGNVDALSGSSVTATAGKSGTNGKDGICYPAVYASVVNGGEELYDDSRKESAKSTTDVATDSLDVLAKKIASFYGVNLTYGTNVANSDLRKHSGYSMTKQSDSEKSMQQMQFLLYTMSMMPKNCWREFHEIKGIKVSIYLVNSINSGGILGLTDTSNNVWFATFDTEVRGVIYGGYYNIMLHEFIHVCHYNMDTDNSIRTSAFNNAIENYNYIEEDGDRIHLDYGKKGNVGVYGVANEEDNTAEGCCFLSAYSRTNVREDVAETLSMCSEFTVLPDFLKKGTVIRKKFDLIVNTFAKVFETMTPLHAPNLFAYDHLFDGEDADNLA